MRKILSFSLSLLMLPILFGSPAVAGEYYMYANFDRSDGFLGGYDVDSYDNYLYVNRGNLIDRYTVSTAVTATSDANTHPNNIGPDGILGTADDNIGPMAVRTLTHDTSYSVPAIGGASVSEIYATAMGLYFLDNASDVSYYDFGTGVTTSGITAASSVNLSQLARGADGTWFASNESNDIYQYGGGAWTKIIDHILTPGGGHLDGLETAFLDVTNDGVDNAVEWLFAADMTSNYMTRYSLDGVSQEIYSYNDPSNMALEGMGFGANNHFWATSGSNLYEIGGGAFEATTDDGGGDDNQPVPEPGTLLLLGAGLIGLAFAKRRSVRED